MQSSVLDTGYLGMSKKSRILPSQASVLMRRKREIRSQNNLELQIMMRTVKEKGCRARRGADGIRCGWLVGEVFSGKVSVKTKSDG